MARIFIAILFFIFLSLTIRFLTLPPAFEMLDNRGEETKEWRPVYNEYSWPEK